MQRPFLGFWPERKRMEKRKVEILAPAGSYESMVAAVNAGANAVYIGGSRFGARAYADNLDEEAMVRAIDFAHLHNCRIYMTVNTLVKEKELPELYGYLKPYYEAGLDAVLVQDLGVFSYIREHFPDLPLHISTQMTVTGKYSAARLKDMGAVRVVPARELSLKEIREICETTGMEVETFVHGALCYCYSGQCLFSSLIGGRSGNRGRCAQTCRLPFDVEKGEKVLSGKNEKYVLSLKDLCTLDLLPEILEAGVCSLKIEGRMKSPRYTAGVVSIYRKYVDLFLARGRSGYRVDPADRRALLELFDRGGQSEGYYKEHNGRDMVVLKEKPAFREPDQELFDYLDRTYVETVKQEPVRGTALVSEGKPVRLTVEYTPSLEPVERLGDGTAVPEPVSAVCTGEPAETAKNAPMDGDRIRKQLMKTGDSPFFFEELEISLEGKVFLPVQALNRLRRETLEELYRAVTERFHRKTEEGHKNTEPENGEGTSGTAAQAAAGETAGEKRAGLQSVPGGQKAEPEFAVSVSSGEQLRETLALVQEKRQAGAETPFGIYLASEEFDPGQWRELADRCHKAGSACYLMMPRIFRSRAERFFLDHMDELKNAGFDAIGVGSMEEPGFLEAHVPGMKQHFDHGMYVFNHRAEMAMKAYGASRVTLPVELNARELSDAGVRGEVIVYGYLPMMVSAQCVKKTMEGCTGRPEVLYLRDRKGKAFPVKNQCRFCFNTIYNESPLSLLGLSAEAARLSPAAYRIALTLEDGETAKRVLRSFYEEYMEGKKQAPPSGNFTRGHFKRGVE